MLHVKQTEVVKARYPVIDIHTHLSHSARQQNGVPLAVDAFFWLIYRFCCRLWTARTSTR